MASTEADASALWDVVKLIIAAALGGLSALLFQRYLPRHLLVTALRADARGAMRFAHSHLGEFEAAAERAAKLARLLEKGGEPSFADVNSLCEGWIISSPTADLLGHGQRFDEQEAYAVMKYLHYWNLIVESEKRYREAVNQFLRLFGSKDGASPPGMLVLREHLARAADNAHQLAVAAAHLQAQARHFHDGRIQALSEVEEDAAQRGASAVGT